MIIEDIREELSLHFERLSMNLRRYDDDELEKRALNLKENTEIVDRLGNSCFIAKIAETTMAVITVTHIQEIIVLIAVRWVTSNQSVLNYRRRKPNTTSINPGATITVIVTEKTMTHKMWYLQLRPRMRSLYIWICYKSDCWHYCNPTTRLYWIASPIFFTFKVTLVYGRISEDICYV
jgi:hypothetical protein